MKLLKSLALAATIAFAMPVYAQFTNGSGGGASSAAEVSPYDRISVSYNNTNLSANKQAGDDDFSLNGVGLEYTHGFALSSAKPVYLEFGVKGRYSLGNYDMDKEELTRKYQFLTAIVPLNVTYAFPVGENVSIAPYAGINFKFHILGKYKNEFEDNIYGDDDDKSFNVFDKKDMGGKDYTWNRFQMGWQVGVGARYDKFYLGLSYGTDFIKSYKNKKASISSSDFVLSLGYCF